MLQTTNAKRMDRLLSLRKLDVTSISNTSVSSELGYETANDDSVSSLYYSINDDTLTDDMASSPTLSDHDAEPNIVSDPLPFCETNPNEGPWSATTVGTDSAMQIPTGQMMPDSLQSFFSSGADVDQTISSNNPQPIISSVVDAIVENSIQAVHRENATDAIASAQNIISSLPLRPSHSTNLPTGSSRIVQELYVVAVTQQQTIKAPDQGIKCLAILWLWIKFWTIYHIHDNHIAAARRATVRFQENDPPRRHGLARRTEVSRRSEMPRQSVLPLSRRTQVEANGQVGGNAQAKSVSFVCDICKKSFQLRSTLNVHKSSHKTECKYCDRTFKKPLALSIHLKENCDKIPLAIRRKILAKEFKNLSTRM